MEDRAYNFAAGPAQMPESVLKKAQAELLNWHGCGMSVMEMSHRGSQFKEIYLEARERLKHLLGVPETHEVLFLQGGATTQFAAIPLNLMGKLGASYAVTGNFSASPRGRPRNTAPSPSPGTAPRRASRAYPARRS